MVHIIGAVRLGRHVWCGSHGGMVVGKDRVSPDLQVDDVIRSLISKGGEIREIKRMVACFILIIITGLKKFCSGAMREK